MGDRNAARHDVMGKVETLPVISVVGGFQNAHVMVPSAFISGVVSSQRGEVRDDRRQSCCVT